MAIFPAGQLVHCEALFGEIEPRRARRTFLTKGRLAEGNLSRFAQVTLHAPVPPVGRLSRLTALAGGGAWEGRHHAGVAGKAARRLGALLVVSRLARRAVPKPGRVAVPAGLAARTYRQAASAGETTCVARRACGSAGPGVTACFAIEARARAVASVGRPPGLACLARGLPFLRCVVAVVAVRARARPRAGVATGRTNGAPVGVACRVLSRQARSAHGRPRDVVGHESNRTQHTVIRDGLGRVLSELAVDACRLVEDEGARRTNIAWKRSPQNQ